MTHLLFRKYKKYTDYIILLFFSLLFLFPVLFIFSTEYPDFIQFIFAHSYKPSVEKLLANEKFEFCYSLLKLLSFLLIVWVSSIWFDFLTIQKKTVTRFLNRVSQTLSLSLKNNSIFFSRLDQKIKICAILIFLIVSVGFFIFLLRVPIGYDELFSYRYYASKGIWTSLSFYNVPNNHVFYNITSSLFISLPLDDEIAIRLPAYLASLVTIYYFFKLCHQQFGATISIVATVLVISLYPFIVYSTNARGYAFVNLFCVLLMYASTQLQQNYKSRKYRYLFIVSGFLGTFSIPSFLYVLFPVYTSLFIYMINQKNKRVMLHFLKDCLVTGMCIILGYCFILLLNNPANLTNPNGGATQFSLHDPHAFLMIENHLKDLSSYLFGKGKALFFITLVTMASLCYNLFRKSKRNPGFATLLSFGMLVSPIVILCLHRVIPFNRTWIYLVFPGGICAGFILETMYTLVKNFIGLKKIHLHSYLMFLCITITLYRLTQFEAKHKRYANIDYAISKLRKENLNAELRNIKSIALTTKGLEYYPAEIIWNLCYKLDKDRWVRLSRLDSITDQDLLIIDKSDIERFKPKLSSYHQLNDLEDLKVFYKK